MMPPLGAVIKLLSKGTHVTENPHEYRLFRAFAITPTRSLKIHYKQVCLWILAERIYIIRIIGKAYAIRFFVAIVLPQERRIKVS